MPAISQNSEVDLISALTEGEECARKNKWAPLKVAMKKLGVLLLLVMCGCVSNRTPPINVTAKVKAYHPQARKTDYADGRWASHDAVVFQIISPAKWQGTNLTIFCFSGDTNIIFKTVGDVFQFQIAEDFLGDRSGSLFDGAVKNPRRITRMSKAR